MYLIDTNVVSELRATKSRPSNSQVVAWTKSVQAEGLFLSVITIFELEKGILSIERRDRAQAAVLRRWLSEVVLTGFSGRMLEIDLDVVTRCAKLHVPTTRPERDAWIAATALVHGMTVVTRNVSDFEPMGVAVVNPWNY